MKESNKMDDTTKLQETHKRIDTGVKVKTCLGEGEVVGKESFYGGKLVRVLVRLKDPSKWAFGHKTDVAAFFEHELFVL
jgi:hypothetical protein